MKRFSLLLAVALLMTMLSTSFVSAEDSILAFEQAEYAVLTGKTVKLKPVAQGIKGKLSYDWASSDENVGTIMKGTFKGLSAGSATITCVATDKEGKSYTAQCVVKVHKPVDRISVAESVVEVAQSDIWAIRDASEELRAAFTHKPTITIEPQDASIQKLEWASSKPNIVAVDEEGNITGVNVGKAVVTGKATDGSGKTVKIQVTVPGCYVTDDNIIITTPEGTLLGYMYASFGGISILDYKISGGVVEDYYSDKEDGEMNFMQLIPIKAGKGTITFTRNGRVLKVVKVQVEHSAVYDSVSYPPAKLSAILENAEAFAGKPVQMKCQVESVKENRVMGVVEAKGEKQYAAFDMKEAPSVEVGKTYTFYGTMAELIEYKTETGLTYTCPVLVNAVAK